MSQSAFGPAANRLAGLAARLLGWRPPEFWAATPAELAAVLAPEADPARAALSTLSPAPLSRAEAQRLMENETWPHRVTPLPAAPMPPRKA